MLFIISGILLIVYTVTWLVKAYGKINCVCVLARACVRVHMWGKLSYIKTGTAPAIVSIHPSRYILMYKQVQIYIQEVLDTYHVMVYEQQLWM